MSKEGQQQHITSIGGQALIEGIMMKSPEKTALAVRCPDKSIDVSYLSEGSIKDKCKILRLPVLRGVAGFIESMAQGYKAMMLSAEKSGFTDIEEESGKKEKKDSAGTKWFRRCLSYRQIFRGDAMVFAFTPASPLFLPSARESVPFRR